jgi:diguanylate cyclase (GGDEF)-like protein/PAS domain S-box-containing protein
VHLWLGATGRGGGAVGFALYDGLIAACGVACFVRARRVAVSRWSWALIGSGILAWAAGELCFRIAAAGPGDPPFPSIADAFYLAYYALCFVAVALLTRSTRRKAVWLDGLTAGFAAATVWAAAAPSAIESGVAGTSSAVATTLAYPVADLLLVALVVNAVALRGWRMNRMWWLLAGGFVVSAVADTLWTSQTALNAYVSGNMIDTLWPTAVLLLALAAWQVPSEAPAEVRAPARPRFAFAMSCLAGIVVLVYDHFEQVSPFVLVLATATLVAASARAAVALFKADRAERDASFRSAVLNEMDAAVTVTDGQGLVTHWSAGAQRLYGFAAHEVIGRPARELVYPYETPEVLDRLRARLEAGETSQAELTARTKDGRTLVVRMRLARLGGAGGFVTISADAQDQLRAESASRLLTALVKSSNDAIISKSPAGTIQSWNHGAERLYGHTAEEAIGQDIGLIVPADRLPEVDGIFQAVQSGEGIESLETERVTREGRLIDVSLTVSPISDSEGRVLGASVIARDITAQRRLERELRYHAEYDTLTGLYNRRRFEVELRRRVGAGGAGGAVIMLDVDHFKFVNDSLGHAAGDELLRGIAATLEKSLDGDGLPGRLGGDEFVVLLPGADETAARELTETLLAKVRSREFPLPVSATAGIAIFGPEDAMTADGVLVAADIALHQAKEAGRDRLNVYSGERGEGLTWINRIREALDDDGLVLHAQPIVDLASGKVSQVELLVRMHNANGEVIGPAAFLPTAERFGLIKEIDRWVIRRGLAIAAGGQKVAINLSGRSFADCDLAPWIEAQIASAGADPANVIFEITETAIIANMEEARRFVERLIALGCGFALDDFGTGFGSLTYLKHLPIGYLKIDREFVRDLASSESDQRIVRSVVTIAREHGMRTVGEGVEDAGALALLREYGVDFAQGYFLGRPGPLQDAAPIPKVGAVALGSRRRRATARPTARRPPRGSGP